MIIQQFFVGGLAHSSYLLGGTRACAIVDPRRDVEIYLEAAKALGMQITHILETHLHADFVSGHLDLAEATGARIVAPRSAGCRFDHVPVAEGDSFDLDDLTIRVLETPGHTPEHVSYVVTDRARGPEPVGVSCGDRLFVWSKLRPVLPTRLGRQAFRRPRRDPSGEALSRAPVGPRPMQPTAWQATPEPLARLVPVRSGRACVARRSPAERPWEWPRALR